MCSQLPLVALMFGFFLQFGSTQKYVYNLQMRTHFFYTFPLQFVLVEASFIGCVSVYAASATNNFMW